MSSAVSSSLSAAIAHAISFLTRPLTSVHPIPTVIKLQLVLEANLTALYGPTWTPREPLFGSASRCLTLSPDRLPPRPIYSACIATGVQWFEWISLLDNRSFDLFVDPGRVIVHFKQRDGSHSHSLTIWADGYDNGYLSKNPSGMLGGQQALHLSSGIDCHPGKTAAQQLLEEDLQEEEHIFSLIAEEISAPPWMTPVNGHFPASVRSPSPFSSTSTFSRCSSRSSDSSSGFSFYTEAMDLKPPKTVESSFRKQSCRERNRQPRVFVDTSRTQVTPYDGGKTTVLTGGVMLGDAYGAATKSNRDSPRWRCH